MKNQVSIVIESELQFLLQKASQYSYVIAHIH